MAMHDNIESQPKLSIGALLLLAVVGLGIVFASGHGHALHDAAHDMRHALGFPCH
jgi:cobalt transporter subunit CbtB